MCQVEDAQELYTKQLNHHQDSLCPPSGKLKVAHDLVVSRVTAGQGCGRSQLWVYVFKVILKYLGPCVNLADSTLQTLEMFWASFIC